MDASTKNVFREFLIEEFEKQKDKKMDVVAAKRKQFKALLDKAENDLRIKSYPTATKNYYSVMQFLKTEPYPDELDLSQEAEYSIKCCFCYSALMDRRGFTEDDIKGVILDVIKELNDKFATRVFPMFLLVLSNLHRGNWLDTLTWCNKIVGHVDEDETAQGTEIFRELLPDLSEIREELDRCEEIALFGYGGELTRNSHIKSRFEKYKTYVRGMDDLLENMTGEPSVNIKELRSLLQEVIFPLDFLNREGNEEQSEVEPKKVKMVKKLCSSTSQTEKIKRNQKSIQTEGPKTRSVEVQVSSQSPVLTAVLEIKNKCLSMHEKKDETIAKLHRRINELQDKVAKDVNVRKTYEREFENKTTNLKSKLEALTQKLAESEEELRKERKKNMVLQKVLVEQVISKYNTRKQHYKIYEKQAYFMVTFLKELLTFLTPKSIPTESVCRENIEVWEEELQKFKEGLAQLDRFYQDVRVEMINSNVYNTPWPEILDMPRLEDNVVFRNFKAAIRNIIQTEENLFWRRAPPDNQGQIQQRPSSAGPYNIPQPTYPGPNNIYVVPPNYGNFPPFPVPAVRPQMPQLPRTFVNSTNPTASGKPTTRMKAELVHKVQGQNLVQQHCQEAQSPSTSKNVDEKKDIDMIILDFVLKHCAGAAEEEVTVALSSLLESKGTLSNYPKEKILQDVKNILRMKKQKTWATVKNPGDWQSEQKEEDCAICFEDFSVHHKFTLPCRHHYHKKCIKKWLKTSSVCPICRVHCVIDDEFPPLD